MFNRKTNHRFYNQNSNAGYGPYMHPQNPQMFEQNFSSGYPELQYNKLQMEIKENRRRINNLAKRIIRIENYLRIRDTSDYSIIEEDQIPTDFNL